MANRFIQKLCGFAELTSRELAALEAATSSPRTLGSRVDLIREGDQPGSVFVILEGWAFRYKVLPKGSRQITAFLMPGDACDLHIGMLAEMDHSIQAATRAEVARISRQTMDATVPSARLTCCSSFTPVRSAPGWPVTTRWSCRSLKQCWRMRSA